MYEININAYDIKKHEKQILEKIFEEPSFYLNMTTNEICESLFISKSSFLRLLKKIKIGTVKQFKYFLLGSLKEKKKGSSFFDIINSNLNKNKDYINQDLIEKLINEIKKFDYIYMVGVSSNYYLIKILEIYLRKLNINAIAVNSWEKINITKKTSIIIFSRTMKSSEIKIIRKNILDFIGLEVFAVTESTKNFKNIKSFKISSNSPIIDFENELPFFYQLNTLIIFIHALINFIKKNSNDYTIKY